MTNDSNKNCDTELSDAERIAEIGSILIDARYRERRTVTECAAVMQTTRHRYRQIEEGNVQVGIVELEKIMRFLNIPPKTIWSEIGTEESLPTKITIRVPSQTEFFHIVFDTTS